MSTVAKPVSTSCPRLRVERRRRDGVRVPVVDRGGDGATRSQRGRHATRPSQEGRHPRTSSRALIGLETSERRDLLTSTETFRGRVSASRPWTRVAIAINRKFRSPPIPRKERGPLPRDAYTGLPPRSLRLLRGPGTRRRRGPPEMPLTRRWLTFLPKGGRDTWP